MYTNTLFSCIFTLKESRVNVRCVSYLATTPMDVRDWVPVNLKELGDTVVIDLRTVEVMDGMDIEFVLQPQTHQIVGIEVHPLGSRLRRPVRDASIEEAGAFLATTPKDVGVPDQSQD